MKKLLKKDILKNIKEEEFLQIERQYPFSSYVNIIINAQHYYKENNLALVKLTELINKTDNPGMAFISVVEFGKNFHKKKRKEKKAKKKNLGKANKNKKEDKEKLANGIVSEELAKIYLKQGLKKQAIEMYRKLILQNPEKSVYFAEILEKLEK